MCPLLVKLIFNSANTQLIDLLRESAPHGFVGTTSADGRRRDQAWLTWRTVGGRATPVAASARLAAGRGGERSRKHLSSCSTLVAVSESRSERMSGHEPLLRADNANGKRFMSRGAIRRGEALLSGLLRCARCGRKLRVRYSDGAPRYQCV